MRRGFTLIELMICIALVGIFSVIGGNAVVVERRAAREELQRERALQLLEYEADCLSSGKKPNQQTVSALSAELPEVTVQHTGERGVSRLAVSWKTRAGVRAERSLLVLTPGGS